MSHLVEFLRARLDEDQAFGSGPVCCCADENRTHDPDCPDRLRREVEAKRRIVDRYVGLQAYAARPYDDAPPYRQHHINALDVVLRDLAEPYADHPDYQTAEWKP